MEMTLTRMETEFESEWILIGAPETDEALNIRGGTVLHHSKDRDEVYRRAISLRPARVAVIFTGAIPEGTAVILRAGLDRRSGLRVAPPRLRRGSGRNPRQRVQVLP